MSEPLRNIVGKGLFWTSSGSVILKVLSLFTIFIVLTRLSVYEYGLVKLATSIIPLLGILTLPGITNVVIADIGTEKGCGRLGKARAILKNFFFLQVILAIVGWAIVYFAAEIIADFYKGQITVLLKVVSFSFLISPIRTVFSVVFGVYFRFLYKSLFSIIEESFKFVLIVFFLFFLSMGPVGFVLAQVLGEVLALVVTFPVFWRVLHPLYRAEDKEHVPLLYLLQNHGKWGLFATYLSNFGRSIRLWIIKFILGTEAVGLFTVAQGILSNTKSLLPLGSIIAPIIPQYMEDRARFFMLAAKSIKYQMAGFMLLGVAMFFVFPYMLVELFPNYTGSIVLFQIILVALIPAAFTATMNPVYFALKRQKDLFFAMVFGTVLIVVFAPIFLQTFGIVGIAYEFVLTGAIFALERYRALRKIIPEFKISLKDFFTIDEYDKEIISLLVMKLEKTLRLLHRRER